MGDANVTALGDYRKPKPRGWDSPGYLHNKIPTARETAEWRRLAATHEQARCRVNDLAEKRVAPESAAYQEALGLYRQECLQVLAYRNARPRHMPSMVRCAADVLGLADPAWNHWLHEGWKKNGETAGMLTILYSRALIAADVDKR